MVELLCVDDCSNVFICLEDGCIFKFLRYGCLFNYLDIGNYIFLVERIFGYV